MSVLGVALYHYFTLLSKVKPLPVTFFQNTLILSYFKLNIINLNKKIEFRKNKAVKGFQSKVK
jgi:hypothetical protein